MMRLRMAIGALPVAGAGALALSALVAPAALAGGSASGNWEGSGAHGSLVSFQLSHGSVSDLVVQTPINCANAFGTPPAADLEVLDGAPVHGGSFTDTTANTTVSGRFSGNRVTLTYRHHVSSVNAYEGGLEKCDTGTIRLSAKPAKRIAITDGTYSGKTDQQQAVMLHLAAGGRALVATPSSPAFEVDGANSNDPCAYQVTSSMFVGATGKFSNAVYQEGDDAVITGGFTPANHKFKGQFTYLAEGCGLQNWSATVVKYIRAPS